jgi:3-oxoacyl-(acyl-carrier-protein) synthase
VDLRVHDGVPVFRRKEARAALARVYADLVPGGGVDAVIGSANGTFIDAIERDALAQRFPEAAVYLPKQSLGESLGASALLQTVVAALTLQRAALPGAVAGTNQIDSVLVSALGFNQQASGAILQRTE